MTNQALKIIIPMAGYGTRLRPHTWSKPKPLVSAAGKTVLGHVLDVLATTPNAENLEIVFIVGYLGDQVQPFMQANYPQVKAHYLMQEEMGGQSHAIAMARDYINGPTLVFFVDTLTPNTDMSFLAEEQAEAVIWVKEVEDPRRFGVVEIDEAGMVRSIIEKPDTIENNLAIIGYYYFQRGEDLIAAIDEQIENKIQTKGEYFLADAMSLMLKKGLRMRAQQVDVWLDAGLPETVLETNRYYLETGQDNTAAAQRPDVTILPPVYIHPDAEVEASTIGPHVSIAADCRVLNSTIENSVLEAGAQVKNAQLTASLVGVRALVQGVTGSVNIGDDSQVRHG